MLIAMCRIRMLDPPACARLHPADGRQFLNTARDIKRQWNWNISTDK